jgi:hypothetical protein
MAIPMVAGALFFISIGAFWFGLLFLLASVSIAKAVLLESLQPDRIRLNSSVLMCWESGVPSQWCWKGHGRLSHAFVQMNLTNEYEETWCLRIWKDSVTDPSWRALNMAFRVNQSAAKTETAVS